MNELMLNWIDWAPMLLKGLTVSLQLTGLALILGLPLGLILAIASSSETYIISYPAIIAVEIGRGTPALIVLYLVFYSLPESGVILSPFLSGMIALALTTAGYTSEILRGGLNSVPNHDVEAGVALGMSHRDILRFIIIPQGVLIAIPPLMSFAILIFQASALTYTVGIPELLSTAYTVGASTFRYLSVLTLAGLFYLAITIPVGWFVSYVERKLGSHLD